MTKDQLASDLQAALTQFEQALSVLPDEQLNTPPYPGSWTPGQVARHIAMSNSGFLQIIHGPTQPSGRPQDAGVEKLRDTLLNFDSKLQAPEFVVPPAIHYGKDRLLASFDKIKAALPPVFDLDLTVTCTAFEMPRLGYFTRWEALHFMLFHTQRHLYQLRTMAGTLAGAKSQ